MTDEITFLNRLVEDLKKGMHFGNPNIDAETCGITVDRLNQATETIARLENKNDEPIERVVDELSDAIKWNWTRMVSQRDAANRVLSLLSSHGLIEQRQHPSGGTVWRVNGHIYGRTDNVEDFDKLQ